jgi:HPt (histidine-containing phosphotransfer) domain-containing protein
MMKIIPEFVEGLAGAVRTMEECLTANDMDRLQTVVHQLRGASGGYGFDDVTEPSIKAERAIKAGENIEKITAEIASLLSVIRRIDGYGECQHAAGLIEAGK